MIRYITLKENYFHSLYYDIDRSKEFLIFVNPSFKELKEIKDKVSNIRGVVNENGNLLVWSGEKTHWQVIEKLMDNYDFNRLYKGNHTYFKNRNYITIKINKYYEVGLGDVEVLKDIKKDDKLSLDLLLDNMLKKNKNLELSKIFIEELEELK